MASPQEMNTSVTHVAVFVALWTSGLDTARSLFWPPRSGT